MNKTWTVVIAAAMASIAIAAVYLLGPRSNTDAVISSMEQSVEESQAQEDKIVVETKRKEVSVRVESKNSAASLSDDELCNAINEMLRQYRRGQ